MKTILDWAIRRAARRGLHFPSGDPDAAQVQPSAPVTLEPAGALVQRIEQLSAAGQHSQALDWARQYASAYPSIDASLLLAGQLRACGQLEQASALLEPLVHQAPDHPGLLQAWVRVAADRRRQGIQPVADAQRAQTAAQLVAQGNAALGAWDLATASSLYAQACHADPTHAAARLNRGFVALEQSLPQQAVEQLSLCLLLLGLWPDDALLADAHFLLGKAWGQCGQIDRALASLQDALRVRSGFPEPLEEGVTLLSSVVRHDEALAWAERLLAARPDTASELVKARALARADRCAPALVLLDGVLAREPDNTTALAGRGEVLQGLDRGQEALACFDRVLALVGPTPAAQRNRAMALRHLGRLAEARAILEDLLVASPEDADTLYNLLLVLQSQGDLTASFERLDAALARHPHDGRFQWPLAIACFLAGDFERAWPAHEGRWHPSIAGSPRKDHGCPAWRGEDLRGRTLLLFAEQGLGDSIQFLRFVALAAARAEHVVLLLPLALHGLARASGLPANCTLLDRLDGQIRCDVDLPLMSLPLALGLRRESDLRMERPYLAPDPARRQAWSDRLQALGPGLRVGLVWSGNPAHRNDHNRSIPLSAFRALETPGCHFISLQPQVRESDQAALAAWTGLHRWGQELESFEDTSALISALDLVVSVDTSVAHLSGAMGHPAWILLPHAPDWRWMLQRSDSPWYPSIRVYRQAAPKDWEPVLGGVRDALEALVRAGKAQALTAPA